MSLCQREIAAPRALELQRITQNINMQIAFFGEGNFISARKYFFHCTQAQNGAVWGPVGATANGELGRAVTLVTILLLPGPEIMPRIGYPLQLATVGVPRMKVKVEVSAAHLCLMTAWTVAHQAPLSMGFSRQEYWSG